MSIFKKDPAKKLEKQYLTKLKEAQTLQRTGKIPEFARASAEADALYRQLQEIKKKQD